MKSRLPKKRKQKLGDFGEGLAAKFLKKKGYKIIKRKFKTKFGEIDVIALRKQTLVFIEVKTRLGSCGGHPEKAVTSTKIRHLKKAAYCFISAYENLPESYRIDVVAITLTPDKKIKRIKHFKNVTME